MRRNVPTPSSEAGFTLIEVMVASFVLLVGMLGVFTLLGVGQATTQKTLARTSGTTLVRDMTERARQVAYKDLEMDADGKPTIQKLIDLPGMGAKDPSTGVWTVTDRRSNAAGNSAVKYTVQADVCKIDDKSDGIGPRDLTFCNLGTSGQEGGGGSGATTLTDVYADLGALGLNTSVILSGASAVCDLLGANPSLDNTLGGPASLIANGADISICPAAGGGQAATDRNPDDMKRLSVTVSWDSPRAESVTQTTMIPNPSGAVAQTGTTS